MQTIVVSHGEKGLTPEDKIIPMLKKWLFAPPKDWFSDTNPISDKGIVCKFKEECKIWRRYDDMECDCEHPDCKNPTYWILWEIFYVIRHVLFTMQKLFSLIHGKEGAPYSLHQNVDNNCRWLMNQRDYLPDSLREIKEWLGDYKEED